MDSDRLNKWMSVGANAGVLIGLALVIMQLNQNETLLRVQIMNQYYDSYIAADSAFAGDNVAEIFEKSMIEPENLSFADMRALESQTFSPMLRWINLYRLSESGIIDDSEWRRQVKADAGYYLGTPYGRAWWEFQSTEEDIMDSFLPAELREYVNAQLEDNGPDNVQFEYRQIQQMLRDRATPKHSDD
jgi:hypothetical protein